MASPKTKRVETIGFHCIIYFRRVFYKIVFLERNIKDKHVRVLT